MTLEIEKYGELDYKDRESTWITLETRNLYVEGVGPIFFREKIKLTGRNTEETAQQIQQYANDLAQRQVRYIAETPLDEIKARLNETNE